MTRLLLLAVLLAGCDSHPCQRCTRSHITTMYVKSGAVFVPIESTTCDAWERIPGCRVPK